MKDPHTKSNDLPPVASSLPTNKKSKPKAIFKWLVILSLLFFALQYEEIADAVSEGTTASPQTSSTKEEIQTRPEQIDYVDISVADHHDDRTAIPPRSNSNDGDVHDHASDNGNDYRDNVKKLNFTKYRSDESKNEFTNFSIQDHKDDNNDNINDRYNSTVNSNSSQPHIANSKPQALHSDVIFQPNRWTTPVVIHRYKLLFYPIPKVACTEWKLLFRRMERQPEWETTGLIMKFLHQPVTNNLTTLDQIPFDEAQDILTSSEWTRAVFVREPKERLLSAYLDKVVNNKLFFRKKCCQARYLNNVSMEDCRSRLDDPEFFHYLKRMTDCPNDHWNPQYTMIDTKWWETVNFVGYLHSVYDDAKRLLESIISVENGLSAWEEFGKTGWGKNKTGAFMQRDTAGHATNAHDKLLSYYTKEGEELVEKYWNSEWNHSVYHFDRFHLFDNSSESIA